MNDTNFKKLQLQGTTKHDVPEPLEFKLLRCFCVYEMIIQSMCSRDCALIEQGISQRKHTSYLRNISRFTPHAWYPNV